MQKSGANEITIENDDTVVTHKTDGKAATGPVSAAKIQFYEPAPLAKASPDVLAFLDGGCPLALPPLARRLEPPLDDLLVALVTPVVAAVADTSLGFLGTGGPSPGITMPHCFAKTNCTSETQVNFSN